MCSLARCFKPKSKVREGEPHSHREVSMQKASVLSCQHKTYRPQVGRGGSGVIISHK